MSARATAFAALLACTTLAGAAQADPTAAAVDEGRARFTKGVAFFRANDFRAALVEFKQAYAVAPSFRIQFNIAQTCAELQDHACATRAFEIFLADGGKQVPPGQRAVAERELKRLHALVGRVHVVVNTASADITVDNVSVGTSPLSEPLTVTAGRRKITATKAPFAPVSSTVDVTAGETAEVSLSLVESNADGPAGPEAGPSRTPFWIGVGVTSALAVATVTFGVLAVGAKSDLDASVGRFGASPSEIDRSRSKLDDLSLATDVLGVATLVGAGVTTFLFFRTRPSSTQVGLGPRSISLTQAF